MQKTPFSSFFQRTKQERERTKISAVTHFSAPSSEKAARSGEFMDGDGKEGRLAACNNTVLAKLQVFPPGLIPIPLFGKAHKDAGRTMQEDGVGDSGHASGSGATSFLFLRCWRKSGG